jgi:hypothetical protein
MEKRKTNIEKTLRGLLGMLVMAGLAVAFLVAANRVPSLAQKGFARQYDTIDEAKRALGIETVLVPAYFPEGISWPPSFVLAQLSPHRSVVMEFRDTKTRETALIVIQSSSTGSDAQLQRIRLSEVTEETPYRLKGKSVLLQVGICDNGKSCSRMTWRDGNLRCTIVLLSSPFELITIAESMIR